MRKFLAAQVADPFDPAPMLVQADWHEEEGDGLTAEALRGLAAGGIPSIVALALTGALMSSTNWADDVGFSSARGPWCASGDGCQRSDFGMTEPLSGGGSGVGDSFLFKRESENDLGDCRLA